MGDVVVLGGLTTLEIPVQRVLDGARDHKTVFVLSYDETGKFCVASSNGRHADAAGYGAAVHSQISER